MTTLRGRSTRLARRHPTATFFVLTYAVSWGLWLPVVLGVDGPLRRALFVAGIFGPAAAGVLTTWLAGESVGVWLRAAFLTRAPLRWWAVAVAVPVTLTLAASAAYALAGGAVDLGLLPARFAAYAPALAVAAVVGGGQEELGWRGFALPRLEARFGPVGGTLVLGGVWALWHLPVVATTADFQHGLGVGALLPVLGLTVLSVVGYAFVLRWVFNRTGSVLVAALLHGGFNTANGALVPLSAGAVAVLVAVTRGRLTLRARSGPGLRVAGVIAGALLLATPASSQPVRAPSAASRAAAVRFATETFPALADSFGVPGAVIAVVGPAVPVALRGFGYADIASRTPADPRRTLFRVASVSKTVTATAVVALAERGALDLHADVNSRGRRRALQRVSVPAAFGAPVTAHALLTHTAGLDERIFGTGSRLPAPALAPYVAATLPRRVSPPGALHSYSNHGYALLGVLAEDVTGRAFPDVVRDLVFEPLGMASSTFRQPAPAALRRRLATGYACPAGGTSGGACTPLSVDAVAVSPAGALQTTAADMGRFATFHLSGAGGALSDSTRRLMHAAQWRPSPALGGMSYGLFRGLVGRHEVLRHAGAWAGWSAQLVIVPDAGLAYVVAVNTDAGPLLDALLRRFAADVLGGPLPVPPRPAVLAPLGRYAGTYRSARHVHVGPDKVALLLGFPAPDLVIRAPSDTALVLTAGGRTVHAFPLGAGAFVTPGLDPRRYAFEADAGRLHSDYGSWERIPWWSGRGVSRWGFAGCALVFATAVAAWALVAVRRRRPRAAASVRWTRALGAASAAGFLAFGVGLAAAAVAMGPQGVVYALPGWVRALFVLPLAGTALGALAAVGVGVLWRRRLGSRATRVHLTAVALAAGLVVPLLALWNLLGIPG